MLRIELSALSAQELKRLLDMARARNQTALIDQLSAELESRPARPEDWAPLPMNYTRPEFAAEADMPPPRRNGMMAATAALAAFVSAAVTWGLSVPPPQPNVAETPRAAVVLASLAPVGPPAGFSEPPVEAPPPEPTAAPVQMASAAPTARSRPGNPCYALSTAAERLVCGYPSLASQDRQMRSAYDRAVAAGADRRDLDRAQALWRASSENVSDRAALSERYARRIRELEVAASPPPPPPPPDDPPF